MENLQLPKVERKTYTKPQVTEVRLVAQEAVLGVCKLNGIQSFCESISFCASMDSSS
jgi:hypothetical protein